MSSSEHTKSPGNWVSRPKQGLPCVVPEICENPFVLHYEPEVRELEDRIRQSTIPRGSIAFYGSSSIRLWKDVASDFPELPVVNIGFGGSTMTACSWFFWRLVRPVQPSALVVYAGENDVGDGTPPQQIHEQFLHLRHQLELSCPGVPMAFIAIKPSPARWTIFDRIQRTNNLLRSEIFARTGDIWVEIRGSMLDAQGLPRPELYLPDGLHLSRAGYLVWRSCLREQVPFLAAPPNQEAGNESRIPPMA